MWGYRKKFGYHLALGAVAMACIAASPSRAADKITLGTVGQPAANLWPVLIAVDKGFFTAEDLQTDNIVFVQSSAALIQQVAAGSLNVAISAGLADPVRAVSMGAPISILRIDVQAPPYDLVAKPEIASLKDLKGKL